MQNNTQLIFDSRHPLFRLRSRSSVWRRAGRSDKPTRERFDVLDRKLTACAVSRTTESAQQGEPKHWRLLRLDRPSIQNRKIFYL